MACAAVTSEMAPFRQLSRDAQLLRHYWGFPTVVLSIEAPRQGHQLNDGVVDGTLLNRLNASDGDAEWQLPLRV
jgi:hypothetical protein